jgi:hypothetical protein
VPPPLDQPIALATIIFVIPLVISLCIFRLRKDHPTEIYIVWYFFALLFVAFSFLHAYAWIKETTVDGIFGQFAWGKWVYHSLTDWKAEVLLVLVFLGLVALPQLSAYILSGLSGSASRPMLVLQATDMAIWSLIKTLASLSGITLAGFLWAQDLSRLITAENLSRLIGAEIFLFVSFALLVYRHWSKSAVEKLRSSIRPHAFDFHLARAFQALGLPRPPDLEIFSEKKMVCAYYGQDAGPYAYFA